MSKNDRNEINQITKFFKYITSKEGIPNLISTLRILSVIPICCLLVAGYQLPATLLFGLASATDFVDGKLARHWHVESKYGKYADVFGDKILVIPTILIYLMNTLSLSLESVLFVGMLTFECAIGATNTISKVFKKKNVNSSKMGKVKTFSLMGTIFLSMLSPSINNDIFNTFANIIAPLVTITLQSLSLKDYVNISESKNIKEDKINNFLNLDSKEKEKNIEKTKKNVNENNSKVENLSIQERLNKIKEQRNILLEHKDNDEKIVKSNQKTFKFDKNKRNK